MLATRFFCPRKNDLYLENINGKMKKIFLFALLFTSTGFLFSQSKEDKERIDSIFTAISNMPEDTQTVNYITNIASAYLWQFDLPETYNRLKYAVKLSQKLKYDNGEAAAYSAMSNFCNRAGAKDFALQYRLKCLDVINRINDTVRINNGWLGLALAYQNIGKYDSALIYYAKCRKAIEAGNDKDKIARLYLFLCWTYQSLANDSLALYYGNRSLQLRKEIKYTGGIMSSLGSIRATYVGIKNYEKAL